MFLLPTLEALKSTLGQAILSSRRENPAFSKRQIQNVALTPTTMTLSYHPLLPFLFKSY
jgi:hypothetical protein